MRIAKDLQRWITARALTVQRIDVAKDSVDYKWHRIDQRLGVMSLHSRRTHRVQTVGENYTGRGHDYHMVQEHRLIVAQHPAMGWALVIHGIELGSPFRKAQEQRHHETAKQKPLRWRNADTHRPRQNAQHKTRGDYEHIKNYDVFQMKRVGNVYQHVNQKNYHYFVGNEKAETKR